MDQAPYPHPYVHAGVTIATSIILFCFFSFPCLLHAAPVDSLASCFTSKGILNFTTPQSNPSTFSALLNFSLQNLRFTEPGVPQPAAIVLPSSTKQVQDAWACIRMGQWALRVRSGGHSYEGLSSTAPSPFVILDLMNMNAVAVNTASKTVWVEAGATLGELYYAISLKTSQYGLTAGTCATIGVGGHMAGGGYGMLSRKYGVAADTVLEAQMVLANGTLLKRVSVQDTDLFWALRGGGGGSWGIVVAWKLRLVPVPAVITTFNVMKTGKQAIVDLAYQWQSVAPSAPPELFVAMNFAGVTSGSATDMASSIYGQCWGDVNETVTLLSKILPSLGLTASDCKQGNWIQAVANIAGVSGPTALLSRQQATRYYFKAKSDYVKIALTTKALSGAFDIMEQNTGGFTIFEPYGGVMDQIKADAIAFPHRAGNLYVIQYLVVWTDDTGSPDDALIAWLRKLYGYMGPYVTESPARAAYVNYIDLDLGDGRASGPRYFGGNFERLVRIKGRVDPTNLFSNPQSIPTSL